MPDPCEVSQNEGKQENQMKKLMFVLVLPILIAGCASPLRIQTTDLSGGVREIEVKNLSGEVIEVNDGFRKKLDERKAALEGEIKNVLEGKVKSGDFKKDYSIPVEGIVAKGGKEPLTEEEMGVFRAVGETLTREYVKQIVYPAWAKKIITPNVSSAKARLADGDYAQAREIMWDAEKTGVAEVDELVRKLGNRFLNREVNPAQWLLLEKELKTAFDAAMAAKDYAGARKSIGDAKGIRTFSKKLETAPSPMADETEDTLKVADGVTSGLLGTVAVNTRLEAFKEKLLAEVAAAEKAELDAKMQAMLDELGKKVASLVEEEKFGEARDAVAAVAQVKDGEWNEKVNAAKKKLLDDVAKAEKAARDAKTQRLLDEFTAKVIALVEEGKFGEARDAIRDIALVDNDEWDAKIYAVRIGLMNSVVNPRQLKHLKAEAAKAIDGLVAEKKYAEAAKFIDDYPYVHDTFDQIKASFGRIEKAMKALKLEDGQAAEYVASRLATVREMLEKRLGKYDGNEDYSELERALSELEKGYVGQHYDDTAATGVTNAIKGEIVAMVDAKYAPLTTWEMNEALRRFLEAKRPQMPADDQGEGLPAPTLGVIADEVDYDSQITMAEAAIAEPSAVYGLAAVLGDYARIMRRCKAGNAVAPEEANTMLVASVFLNQPEMFKLALTLKADVNTAARRDPLARAPILLAAQLGRTEFVKLVRDANGKPDVIDANGNTLLHYATERGNLALARAVVPAVKIDAANKAGETALFVAVRRNQLAAVKAILRLAGDAAAQKTYVAIANANGQNAFDVACVSNAHMLLDTLAAAGAEYDERHLAAALGADCIGVAQWLVEKGLDVNADIVQRQAAKVRPVPPTLPSATYSYLVAEGLKVETEEAPSKDTKPSEKAAE